MRAPRPASERLMARQRHGIKPGFERLEDLLDRLGRPERDLQTVIVGGTNGKGSTAATLDAILSAAGFSTGLFTSPHLEQPGERIRINGQPLSADAFEELASRIEPHVDAAGATFFEAVTAMAFLAFNETNVERVVLEVGMGGRLDATNVAPRDAVLITNVALDHEAYLGPTVEHIAAEKAGLIRTPAPVFTTAQGVAREVIHAQAERVGATVVTVPGCDASTAAATLEPQDLMLSWRGGRLALRTPLLGAHQVGNVQLAATAALHLGVPQAAVQAGVAATQWPGRMERLDAGGRLGQADWLLLDGAHNPAAAEALAAALAAFNGTIAWVAGFSSDKDVTSIAQALAPVCTSVYATAASGAPRSLDPQEAATRLQNAGLRVDGAAGDVGEAVQQAAASHDGVLVAGSLFLVADVRAWWFGRTPPGGLRLQ